MKGANDRDWCADFDWIHAADQLSKILEGKYDDKEERPWNGSGTYWRE
jgi:hypothetical protein